MMDQQTKATARFVGRQTLFLFGLVMLILLAQTTVVFSQVPENVELLYFDLEAAPNGVLVLWATATEQNTIGFRVERATNAEGPYASPIPEMLFIPQQGNELVGATYQILDNTAGIGQTYWYKLIEIESDLTEIELDIENIVLGTTPTPTATSGVTPIAATETLPPTSTIAVSPTSTRNAGTATVTLVFSPTPTPTLTLGPTATATNTPISVGNNPTVTPFRFPTAASSSEGVPVVEGAGPIAQATGLATGYPPPIQTDDIPTLILNTPSIGYPVQVSPQATLGELPIFPNATTINTLPEQGNNSQDLPPLMEGAETESSIGSRLLLWGGFCAAFLVFLGGVYGSILFFRRRSK